MKQKLVYDLPTRFFHWLFAGLFITAFLIANLVDGDSPRFAFHMLAGLMVGCVVLLRLIWGVIGSMHARFSDFALRPSNLLAYFKGILSGDLTRWAGHNPASSWAAIIMMTCALGMVTTGTMMTNGVDLDFLGEAHEVIAYTFLTAAILHVLGIAVHTIRHKEWIGLSMLTGKKDNISDSDSIPSARAGVAVVFLILVAGFAAHLYRSFDSAQGTLELFGKTLKLSEGELEGSHLEVDSD